MAETDTPKPSFSSGRRWAIALNTILAIGAALALVVIAIYLAGGYFKRYQWSRDAAFELSPQTLRVLESLTNDVDVTLFFQPNGDNQEIYQLSKSLLAEYQNANPHRIHVKVLDYTRQVGPAKELLMKYNLTEQVGKDFVLFEANKHSKIVYAKELADYDFSDLISGRSKYVRRSAFRGEMYFTGDIYAVSNPQALKAYFLYGDGEKNPGSATEKEKLEPDAYSKFATILKQEINCDWDRLILQGTNGIPTDCQLLIIAAGAHEIRFSPAEVDQIATYLKQGGRLLALLTVESGLEPLLAQWGVIVQSDRVIDTNADYTVDRYTFRTAQWVPHPIINPLASEKLSVLMVWPRPLTRVEQRNKIPGAPEVSLLALTSRDGVDTNNQAGVYGLLACVEQGVIQGVTSPRNGGTRIIVAGDADFLDDRVIDYMAGNHYFASRALNWLLERPPILLNGLGPQPIKEYSFSLTASETRMVQWLFLAGMPGAVLALGGLVWLRRRK